MPDAIAATGGRTASAAAAAARTPATAVVDRPDQFGNETFLKLLVAQLRYQNPMSPADGGEFLAQTAQFSTVERLQELVNQNNELLAAQRTVTAGGLVGREVDWTRADDTAATGVVTGVRLDPTGPVLLVGDEEVPLAGVQEVRQARP